MNKTFATLAVLALAAGVTMAGSISSVSSYSAPNMVSEINVALQEGDARMDALESSMSTGTVSVADLTITAGDISAVTDAGTATNTLVSNATIDGEYIGNDTIDDDSIDFSDVTGADLTLTDCGAITSSGAIQGTSLRLSATQYMAIVSSTQLVFVSGSTTNVLDADITTP